MCVPDKLNTMLSRKKRKKEKPSSILEAILRMFLITFCFFVFFFYNLASEIGNQKSFCFPLCGMRKKNCDK